MADFGITGSLNNPDIRQMNASNAKDYLPLVAALAEGKTIQKGLIGHWDDVQELDLMSDPKHYRIKPEPRHWWIRWDHTDLCGQASPYPPHEHEKHIYIETIEVLK